jgi:hypothetical protein
VSDLDSSSSFSGARPGRNWTLTRIMMISETNRISLNFNGRGTAPPGVKAARRCPGVHTVTEAASCRTTVRVGLGNLPVDMKPGPMIVTHIVTVT